MRRSTSVERAVGDRKVVGIFNLTARDAKADLFDSALAGEWRDAFTGETVKLDVGGAAGDEGVAVSRARRAKFINVGGALCPDCLLRASVGA